MPDRDDVPSKTDWTAINDLATKRATGNILPALSEELQAPPPATGLQRPEPNKGAQPQGVIAKFKANAITRKATLRYLEEYYDRQLEAAQHQLVEVVRVRKAEATAVAEQMLESINSQQMQFLVEVGLRNEAVRQKALIALNDQTSATLKQILEADWPQALRTQAVDGILERNRKFFSKLMTDLGEK